MENIAFKASTLIEALPYIQKYENKIFVIKYGGAAMIEERLKQSFAKDVTLLKKIGIHVIVVHGGGKEITKIADAFGIETKFINGMRYTDSSMIYAVIMGLTTLNKQISSYISQNLGNAIGLCGGDSNLLLTNPIDSETLGYVGSVKYVNVTLLEKLIASDMIPVIAPLGIGDDKKFYNINADLAASAIATALNAEKLVYLSDIPGVQNGNELIPTLTRKLVKKLFEENKISGGMIPKIESAFDALSKGVSKVHFIDGRTPNSLLLEIFTNEGIGTQIIN